MGEPTLWVSRLVKGLTAQGCLMTVLGAAGVIVLPQGRNSGLQVSVSITQGVGGQRGTGVAVLLGREWSRKASLAGSFFLSRSSLCLALLLDALVTWHCLLSGLSADPVQPQFCCRITDTYITKEIQLSLNPANPCSIPGLGRSPGEGNTTPVFLTGKSHRQRRLVSYSP